MTWGLIFLTALLAACLLAAPAAAGIKRFTDSQGVIRITNIAPAKPGQIPASTAAAAPAAPEASKEVAARPPARAPEAEAAPPSPGETAQTAPTLVKSSPAVAPAPQPGANLREARENQEIAKSTEGEEPAGSLPLRRVAYDPEDAGAVRPPAAQDKSRRQPVVITEGGIHRYRNRQGVLVITNVPAGPSKAAASWPQVTRATGPGDHIPGKENDQTGGFPGAPGLRPVSWSPDRPLAPPGPVAAATTGRGVPGSPGSIHRYRDKRGVIHIENPGAGTPVSPTPPVLPARPEPVQITGPPEPALAPPEKAAAPQWAEKPAPLPPQPAEPLQVLTAAASPQAETILPGGVRRYRDRLGIWRIETVDASWLLEAPPLPRPAAGPQGVLLAAARTAAELPAAILAPVLPPPPRLAAPRRLGGITAVRDRQGRLRITNAPPQVEPGHDPSWKMACAQLDPIIQEAARAYRLPPGLVRALIKVESNFINAAVSPKGAMGLMQLMPGTAEFLGVEEPFNPWQNIHGGCRYLRLLIDSFGGSLPLALAGYNAGPQRVMDCGYRVPEIKETQDFLSRVLEWYFSDEKKTGRPWT